METKLARISQLSRENPEMVFTSIGHLISTELLKECNRSDACRDRQSHEQTSKVKKGLYAFSSSAYERGLPIDKNEVIIEKNEVVL